MSRVVDVNGVVPDIGRNMAVARTRCVFIATDGRRLQLRSVPIGLPLLCERAAPNRVIGSMLGAMAVE